MSSPDQHLAEIITAEGVELVGNIVRDEAGPDVYAQINLAIKDDGSRSPTRNQLVKLKQRFFELGLTLHPLLVSQMSGQFEELLRATLFLAYPDRLRNVFCSLGVKTALVWIEPKQSISVEVRMAIERSAQKFCESQDFELLGLASLGEADTPGKVAILSALRVIAPAESEALVTSLRSKGFTVPSADWLSRQLDGYRKSGNIIFTADKRYALTANALKALGTSKNGRKSLSTTTRVHANQVR